MCSLLIRNWMVIWVKTHCWLEPCIFNLYYHSKSNLQSSCLFATLYISILVLNERSSKWLKKRHTTNFNQHASFTYFSACQIVFYQAHLNTISPKVWFVHLVLCMHSSCLFCSYLLMGFLFCITLLPLSLLYSSPTQLSLLLL